MLVPVSNRKYSSLCNRHINSIRTSRKEESLILSPIRAATDSLKLILRSQNWRTWSKLARPTENWAKESKEGAVETEARVTQPSERRWFYLKTYAEKRIKTTICSRKSETSSSLFLQRQFLPYNSNRRSHWLRPRTSPQELKTLQTSFWRSTRQTCASVSKSVKMRALTSRRRN